MRPPALLAAEHEQLLNMHAGFHNRTGRADFSAVGGAANGAPANGDRCALLHLEVLSNWCLHLAERNDILTEAFCTNLTG